MDILFKLEKIIYLESLCKEVGQLNPKSTLSQNDMYSDCKDNCCDCLYFLHLDGEYCLNSETLKNYKDYK